MIRSLLKLPALGPRRPRKEGLHLPPSECETGHAWHLRHAKESDYRLVAPAHCGTMQPEKVTHPAFENHPLWQMREYEVAPTYTLEIPYGRVVGKKGAVVTHDGIMLSDLSREFLVAGQRHSLLEDHSTLRPAKRVKGIHALLGSHGFCTYHWLFSMLTRVEVLRKAGYKLEEFDSIVARKPKFPEHIALLEKAGVPMDKIHWFTKNSHYEFERLVIPSYTCNETRGNQPFVYPFLESLVGDDFTPPSPRLRLYISREDCLDPRRRVVNEKEIFSILELEGFQKVTLTGLDVMAQARLFASAEIIVAPHGGGLANLAFARRPMKVMEFFAPDYLQISMRILSRDKGFCYYPFMGDHIPANGEVSLGQDIRINPEQFKIALLNLLAT